MRCQASSGRSCKRDARMLCVWHNKIKSFLKMTEEKSTFLCVRRAFNSDMLHLCKLLFTRLTGTTEVAETRPVHSECSQH
jgi:hypothetical protein